MRILVIEDDKRIAGFIARGLKKSGYTVDQANDGEEGLRLALAESYDAAIVDVMLPKLDGLSVISEIRKKGFNIPVIILSAKRSIEDRIKGLKTGSDDYLTKPFSFSELLARVEALIRRDSRSVEATTLRIGDLTIDFLSREVRRENRKMELQPREFALLEYMARNKGRVLSKTLILENVWDYDFDPQTNMVDVLVCRLRNKIDTGFQTKMIRTFRGVGYVLKES
ncbi:MAG: response regulator transcription factor [Bdellovibrionales bacterium]|nr:response regulator transcription factor [Bdellovibrionales bacterium]